MFPGRSHRPAFIVPPQRPYQPVAEVLLGEVPPADLFGLGRKGAMAGKRLRLVHRSHGGSSRCHLSLAWPRPPPLRWLSRWAAGALPGQSSAHFRQLNRPCVPARRPARPPQTIKHSIKIPGPI